MDFFSKFGQFTSLMKNLPRLQEETVKMRERLAQKSVEGDAGAGMVKVTVNGRMDVLKCTLSEEAVKLGDREMLEDLIRAATNQALEKARQMVAEETRQMMTSMGLPALPVGFEMPGLG